ncbi:hypothetical protein L7F22_056504 [Adiantum nelumboides]|nr:hypothetical protein [Adiantum nelumboides]
MKLSLIGQARGWFLQNRVYSRRWAFQRFYTCNSENDDELNNNEHEAEKESPLRQEPLKKKRVSSLTDLQSRLSLLESNMLKAFQDSQFSRSKEMAELRAEVAKVCNSEVEEKANKLLDKLSALMDLNCMSKDVTVVQKEKQNKIAGVDAKMEITWPIDNAEMLTFNDRTPLLRLQTGLHEVVEKMVKIQKASKELHEEAVRKEKEQHQQVVKKYLPKDCINLVFVKTEELPEDVVKDMEGLIVTVVRKMTELYMESRELQEEIVLWALEVKRLNLIQDNDGEGLSDKLSSLSQSEGRGLVVEKMLKLFVEVEDKLAKIRKSELRSLFCLEVQLPGCHDFRGIWLDNDAIAMDIQSQIVFFSLATIIWLGRVDLIMMDIKDLYKMSKQLQLVTKGEQEPGVKPGASYGDTHNYPAKIEDLMQGMQEELQGLHVLLVLREKEESTHRVTVDNQQIESSKRIWEELRRLQCGMSVLEKELRDCMEPLKKLDQKQVLLESTSGGKVHSDVVLVTLSSVFLACSTAVCAWTFIMC